MHAVEFTAELSGAATLPIPEIAARLPKTGRARIIVLTEENADDAERQADTDEQFLREPTPEEMRRTEADEAEWDRLFNDEEKTARFAAWAERSFAEHPPEPFDEFKRDLAGQRGFLGAVPCVARVDPRSSSPSVPSVP